MKSARPYQGSALPLSYGSFARCFHDFRAFVNRRSGRIMQDGAEPCGNPSPRVAHGCTSLFAWRSPPPSPQPTMEKKMPERVQLKRTKGWRMPDNTVKVDRTTKWGNPNVVGDYVSRYEAVECFRSMLKSPDEGEFSLRSYYPSEAEIRQHLAGKNLACWCSLPNDGEPDLCHAGALLELANAPTAKGASDAQP